MTTQTWEKRVFIRIPPQWVQAAAARADAEFRKSRPSAAKWYRCAQCSPAAILGCGTAPAARRGYFTDIF